MIQPTLFDTDENYTVESISNPKTYKGIYAFHKYWGKKPIESLDYCIENCTNKNDIILDPFLGSGLISKEAHNLGRRFLGIDINPFSIEHTLFLLSLPKADDYKKAITSIKKNVFSKISETYIIENSDIATHFLWNKDKLQEVWIKNNTSRKKIQLEPSEFDSNKIKSFENYSVRNIQKGTFFENARINSLENMTIYDLFTKRALYNIDLILDEINKFSGNLKRSLQLTLTASSGQMSNMVFAITGRGKTKNQQSEKIEVGSWVIGLWRPDLHFEINVWNCFENRANKLYKALLEQDSSQILYKNNIFDFYEKQADMGIVQGNSKNELKKIPSGSVKLIITDPPHSDRIPYLELSEMWNCLLNKKSEFSEEIVVSNAKSRKKSKDEYLNDMREILNEASRILTNDGYLLLYFNAKDKNSWSFFDSIEKQNSLVYLGSFPMEYSANSVVQDNRKGAMKSDYVLVFNHSRTEQTLGIFNKIDGWTNNKPFKEVKNA
ncbi:DNA methyltransferase [Treponema pedis]|uniref:Methyltransferase n=1 Tax=Treponema pedis str. T A4 TaxID=1291379 RepID=S5ZUA8_9SPIR|nr:DNA methyltransferase [Treponema pedis]AGT43775.1 hypothetical protein TPE_1280 [Treponema pedis str. T A4]QSI04535.1 DNA methylase [Treponema pedis]